MRKRTRRYSIEEKQAAKNERGATMLEYGVMVALILVGSIAAVKGIGETIKNNFVEVQLAQGGIVPP